MTFPGNEKALTNHCLLHLGRAEEEEGCWRHHLSFCGSIIFLCKCIYMYVSRLEVELLLGREVGHHTTNTSVYDQGDDGICFALSFCTGLPALFFFLLFFSSLNWPWLKRGIVLAKMWKGYAWLHTSRFSNLLSTTQREEKASPFFFSFCSLNCI